MHNISFRCATYNMMRCVFPQYLLWELLSSMELGFCQILSLHLLRCVCVLSCFSCVWLFATLWTVPHQAPLPMAFSRQEYWSGSPCPPPGIFPTQGSNPSLFCLLLWQAGSLPLAPPGKLQKGLGQWKYSVGYPMMDTSHYIFVETHRMYHPRWNLM